MHNCKETKERLTELALDEAVLPEDLSRCDECRAEFEAVNATLRATARLRETVTPPEDYWTSYHALLRERLFHAEAQSRKEERVPFFAPLRELTREIFQVFGPCSCTAWHRSDHSLLAPRSICVSTTSHSAAKPNRRPRPCRSSGDPGKNRHASCLSRPPPHVEILKARRCYPRT